jgi:hypothetical protein
LPRDGAFVGFLWGSWPSRSLRAPLGLPLFVRFAQVGGLLGSFQMVVKDKIELSTFRLQDGLSRLGTVITRQITQPCSPAFG